MNNKQSDDFLEARAQASNTGAAGRRRGGRARAQAPRRPAAAAEDAAVASAGVLLDWQFAPAWPRVAALACCAALGFVIGIAGVDRRFDGGGSPVTIASNTDIGSIVFEPEALTGARP